MVERFLSPFRFTTSQWWTFFFHQILIKFYSRNWLCFDCNTITANTQTWLYIIIIIKFFQIKKSGSPWNCSFGCYKKIFSRFTQFIHLEILWFPIFLKGFFWIKMNIFEKKDQPNDNGEECTILTEKISEKGPW